MAKTAFTLNLNVQGARETLQALRKLPKEASNQLRDASVELSEELAGRVRAAAHADRSPQSGLLSTTVKARRDRLPVIVAGGTRKLGSRKAPAWKLLFGSEFGSNQYEQFHKAHQGRRGSWFFPVVEAEQETIAQRWQAAADAVIASFGGDG